MKHKEIIDTLIAIAEVTSTLEHDNGATQAIQNLIASLEADQSV